MNMSVDIQAPAAPLAKGDRVRVTAATYSAVRRGSVGVVLEVHRGTRPKDEPLYVLRSWPEVYFWSSELARVEEWK